MGVFLLPIAWVFILPIIGLFVMLSRLKKWKQNTGNIHPNVKTLICIGAYILFVFGVKEVLIGDYAKSSIVDVTPFMQLEDIVFDDIDGVIVKLQGAEDELGAKFFNIDSIKGSVRRCEYNYYKDTEGYGSTTSIGITIDFFEDSEQAKSVFNKHMDKSDYRFIKKAKYVSISDSIDALLGKSRLKRSSDTFYLYSSDRSVNTVVRINNVIIKLEEDAFRGYTVGQASNEAIEKLCKVLADWATQHPAQTHAQ